MNFYWRQTIVGLLRHAAATIPAVHDRATETAEHLDQTLTTPWLEEAFALFEEASLLSRDPVYVTGAFYSIRAMEEVSRWERQSGSTVETGGSPATTRLRNYTAVQDEVSVEVQEGLLDLFERIRRGATLEEALALFPSIGEEETPQ